MKKLRRNDPCWCGSGTKYKHCHFGREQQPRPSIDESITAFRRVQKRQMCLHPDASPETCAGGIVRAHTVQKQMLRKIARKGHVYGFALDFGAFVSSQGVPRPSLIGVERASIFTGFCSKHDNQLFAEVEKNPIQACPEHAILLGYRSLCRELFAKEGGVMLDPHRRTMDRGLLIEGQTRLQSHNSNLMSGLNVGLREVQDRKKIYDELIRANNVSSIKYYAIWFEDPPEIMCAGWTSPKWDFHGQQIQDLSDLAQPSQGISLALVASEDRGCALFTWLEHEEDACVALLRSLALLPEDRVVAAIVRLVFSSFENQYWQPEWWESLGDAQQKQLLGRLIESIHPAIPIQPDYLKDDNVQVVNWRIIDRETNVPGMLKEGEMSNGG